jgi:hypothetical protein
MSGAISLRYFSEYLYPCRLGVPLLTPDAREAPKCLDSLHDHAGVRVSSYPSQRYLLIQIIILAHVTGEMNDPPLIAECYANGVSCQPLTSERRRSITEVACVV